MAYTTINKSSDYFNTKLYTGNATDDTAITGVGFTPSFLWGKNRTDAGTNHFLIDAVRGVTKELNTNNTSAEGTDATLIKSFDSDGFTLGDGSLNQSAKNFVTWNWKANGQGSSNTDGSITSTVSANTTSGFSIVTYTGTSSNETVGHGLGVTPSLIIARPYSTTSNWTVWHKSIPITQYLFLNTTAGLDTANQWQDTLPTSNVFYTSTGSTPNLASGTSQIAYCFAERKGFSKFSSFVGNGSTDGVFCYTGFRPAWVMVKKSSASGDNWSILDSTRNTFNVMNKYLDPNSTNAEGTADIWDFTSNGFKMRNTFSGYNASSDYIYHAFAEHPLVSSNDIPATAR